MTANFNFFSNQKLVKRIFISLLMIITVSMYIKLHNTTNNSPHVLSRNNLLNLANFHYIISDDICTDDDIFLLILIHSAPDHFHHRTLIRNTWGNPDSKIQKIKVIFLLAAAPDLQDDIDIESDAYKDIVQGDFIDSYRNLTYKHAMGLKWAAENCAQASFLMKMDDDIFMDVFQFMEYITEDLNPTKMTGKIACFVQQGMPVVRDPVSKWYVSKMEYTRDVFENYCSGWAYVTTIHIARVLFKRLQKLDYFWIDDVHVTGTAARLSNISHIKINNLFDLESGGLVDWSAALENLKWNKVFAPTWGDLELSRTAYRKTLKCWLTNCKCCYTRKTTVRPKQVPTTKKGVAQLLQL